MPSAENPANGVKQRNAATIIDKKTFVAVFMSTSWFLCFGVLKWFVSGCPPGKMQGGRISKKIFVYLLYTNNSLKSQIEFPPSFFKASSAEFSIETTISCEKFLENPANDPRDMAEAIRSMI